MGKYNIEVHKEDKILKIELIGSLDDEQAHEFVDSFFEAQEGIIPSECKIIFNLGYCELYPIDVEEILKPFFLMYKENNYDLIMMEVFKAQKELAYQMARLANKVGLASFDFRVIE
ncbi:MAG: hypothetical protein Q4F66_10400 [Clostridium sp.]|nr:hypothetical protein [Clostridium sp.]